MKHVLCPGFAKSGTTLLHKMFDERSSFAVPKRRKEIKYFIEGEASMITYLQEYDVGLSQVGTFEASPQYMTALDEDKMCETLEKAKRALPGVKIIICLRHPVLRAFSHYIHNLQFYARYGFRHSDPGKQNRFRSVYSRSFLEAVLLEENIGTLYLPKVRKVLEIFGPKHCRFFMLERDVQRPSEIAREMTEFLELSAPLEWPHFPKVLAGGRVPAYVFGQDASSAVEVDKRRYAVPRGTLYVACDLGNSLTSDLAPPLAKRILASQSRWTRKLQADIAEQLYIRYFRDDFRATLNAVAEVNHDPGVRDFYESYTIAPKAIEKATPNAQFVCEQLRPI